MFGLIPKEERFFEMFERAAANGLAVGQAFKALVVSWDRLEERMKDIKRLEHEGDIITHEIMDRLNRTFITPIDREDIHALASALDDIVDIVDSTTNRMMLYKAGRPPAQFISLVDILIRAIETVQPTVAGLRDLARSRRVLDYCIEINRIENEGDAVVQRALADLFVDGVNPLDVIKWKELYESTENAIDKCEDVANIIEGIVVKNA